jgi:hypothetical protein
MHKEDPKKGGGASRGQQARTKKRTKHQVECCCHFVFGFDYHFVLGAGEDECN